MRFNCIFMKIICVLFFNSNYSYFKKVILIIIDFRIKIGGLIKVKRIFFILNTLKILFIMINFIYLFKAEIIIIPQVDFFKYLL